MASYSQINLLSSLLVAAQCDGAPVTYLILTLRLNGFGGDRVCRGLIEDLKRARFISIDQCPMRADRRTKLVNVTEQGWRALKGYAGVVNQSLEDGPRVVEGATVRRHQEGRWQPVDKRADPMEPPTDLPRL